MSHRRIIQIALVSICSLLIAGLAVTNATANLAGCDNCVEAGDIATGAVNAAELDNDLDDSITANDIADGAINKGELGSDSVGLSELLNSATPAVGQVLLDNNSTTSTTADTLDSFSVTAPGDGYLYVEVSGGFYFDVDAPADTNSIDSGQIALCDVVDSTASADCGGTDSMTPFYQETEDATPSGTSHTEFFHLARVVPVSAGDQTFYLNGVAASATDALILWDLVQVTAMFFPATLTVTDID